VNPVDRRRVQAAFSRGAGGYDGRARTQRAVQDRVLALAAEVAPAARRVLDVGAGTGALLARLRTARPGLAAAAVDVAPGMCAAARTALPGALVLRADAESLPFRAAAFDLVLSTSTFQWLAHPGRALAEVRRVLEPGGTFCLALFGTRTLRELRDAWRAAASGAARERLHRFVGRDDLAGALREAGLAPRAVLEEDLVERHPDARAVLRSLKALGASSAVPAARGLGGRAQTLAALRLYDGRHGGPEGVPATFHVIYAVATGSAQGQPEGTPAESPDLLRGSHPGDRGAEGHDAHPRSFASPRGRPLPAHGSP
jgi:malonyl-CoA O-methyltransferase